jgi:hypothetical protein
MFDQGEPQLLGGGDFSEAAAPRGNHEVPGAQASSRSSHAVSRSATLIGPASVLPLVIGSLRTSSFHLVAVCDPRGPRRCALYVSIAEFQCGSDGVLSFAAFSHPGLRNWHGNSRCPERVIWQPFFTKRVSSRFEGMCRHQLFKARRMR